jgi:hypothetical protein
MAKITKCPPGKAIGADDLQIWARQRNGGLSGVPDHRYQERWQHKQKPPEKTLRPIEEMVSDPWFSRLLKAGCKPWPQKTSARGASPRGTLNRIPTHWNVALKLHRTATRRTISSIRATVHRQLFLHWPPLLLARADEVIE